MIYARRVRVGIDFGTTRTVVSSAEDGRHPVAAFEVDGGHREWIPGVVTERAGVIAYGWDAVRELPHADAVIRSLKRSVASRRADERGDPHGLDHVVVGEGDDELAHDDSFSPAPVGFGSTGLSSSP